jgi:hypothetical protein
MTKQIIEHFSGELLDIVINSFNNKYGRAKIVSSIQNGIFSPLSKYIEELKTISADTVDDKSYKRQLRLFFLEQCQENDTENLFKLFFKYLLCWLNGGGDKPSGTIYAPGEYNFSQYTQKIILTVSGGNIIIIFAKLLQNIYDSESYEKLTITNKKIIEELYRVELSSSVANPVQLYNSYKILITKIISSIKPISENDFSDFDYGLLPNKSMNRSEYEIQEFFEEFQGNDEAVTGEDAGFLLARVKTNITYKLLPDVFAFLCF